MATWRPSLFLLFDTFHDHMLKSRMLCSGSLGTEIFSLFSGRQTSDGVVGLRRRTSCSLPGGAELDGVSVATLSELAASEVTWSRRCWLVRTLSWQRDEGFSQQLSHMMSHVWL